jgi:hypothetical protein
LYAFPTGGEPSSLRSPFHLLDQAELEALRCFMTLLLLPSHTGAMVPTGTPFLAAIDRLLRLPQFREMPGFRDLQDREWAVLGSAPILVLMIADHIPVWLRSLANRTDVVALTPAEEVADQLRSFDRLHVGVLRGFEDLRQAYRAFADLFRTLQQRTDDRDDRALHQTLTNGDLLNSRPRLSFLPPLALP